MEVKKYRGQSIGEVMTKVRTTLGPDAMIISTRKVDEKKSLFEIAALPSGGNTDAPDSTPLGDLKLQLMSLKDLVYVMNDSPGMMEKLIASPAILQLYAKLIRNGVSDRNAKLLLERGGALGDYPVRDAKNIKKRTLREIVKAIGIKDPFKPENGKRVIVAFVGTTGVGKTTTIAKLASQLMFKAKKKVGLISIDGYRIGAMEQLRTYANILGIPCVPAFNRKDFTWALRKMEDQEVVLVDTAGHSPYDKSRIEILKETMGSEFKVSCHLLLSVATSEPAMAMTAASFKAINVESYVFTKLDECVRAGSVLNQVMNVPLPLSYLTNGQSVPEHIEKADRIRILNLILSKN